MLRFTPMDTQPGAVDYLLARTGCAHIRSQRDIEMEQAAERGDVVAYMQAGSGHEASSPGRWGGVVAQFGLTPGATADEAAVRALLGELRNPVTGEQLGAAPKNYPSPAERMKQKLEAEPNASGQRRHEMLREAKAGQQTARAFFDGTFSAQKSISILYASLTALGEDEQAQAVLDGHRKGIEAAMAHADQEGCWVRRGYHRSVDGQSVGRYEPGQGFMWIAFDHSTSRAEEPQLHTHVAIPNKIQAPDGSWLAIHNKMFGQVKASMDAIYQSVMTEHIAANTEARFELRPDGLVREVAGITEDDRDASSSRRDEVKAREQERYAAFRHKYGREPNPTEARRLNKAAAKAKRAPKSGRSADEQYSNWSVQDHIDPEKLREKWRTRAAEIDQQGSDQGERFTHETLLRVSLDEVQSQSSTWKAGEVVARLAAKLPEGMDVNREELAQRLVREAVARGNEYGVVSLARPDPIRVPGWWHDERGEAYWRDPAGGAYALASQMDAEQRLCADAARPGARKLTAEQLVAVEAELATAAVPLSSDQRNAVLGILSSDKAADVFVAPAGTGKSFCGDVLEDQWSAHHGGRVIGTSLGQAATEVLAESGLDEAYNTKRLLNRFDPGTEGSWDRLTDRDLLIVDEAGMCPTSELNRLLTVAGQAGAKVVLQGDPKQLPPVGAGGGLGMLANRNGSYSLETVHRFEQEWEREASLALRDGNIEQALNAYETAGRIRSGSLDEIREQAVKANYHDLTEGLRSIIICGSNEDAADVSGLVQQRLLSYGEVNAERRVGALSDGNTAYAGDVLQARDTYRHNGQRLTYNREFLQVLSDRPGAPGGERTVMCRRMGSDQDEQVELPASFLASSATLGYAGTQHAYQGTSVDCGHALVPGYVPMTRGKKLNVAYVETDRPGSAEQPRVQSTARQELVTALSRDDETTTAVEYWEAQQRAAVNMGSMLQVFDEMGTTLDRDRHLDMLREVVSPEVLDRLDAEDGAGGLYTTIRRAEQDGHQVEPLLVQAVEQGGFDGARDLSRVLRARFARQVKHDEPDPSRVPDSWRDRAVPIAGELGESHRRLGAKMDATIADLGQGVAATMPAWAESNLGPCPEQEQQRQEWITRAGRIAAWRQTVRLPESVTTLGNAPEKDQLAERRAFADASRAAGRTGDALDLSLTTDEQLAGMVSRWDRELAWAPTYVALEQGKAHELAHVFAVDATNQQARAEYAVEQEKQAATEAAERSTRISERMAARAERLDEAAGVWQQWESLMAPRREAAEGARAELERRHGPSETTEQPEAEAEGLFPPITREHERQQDLQAVEQDEQAREAEREIVDEQQAELFPAPRDATAEASVEAAELDRESVEDTPAAERAITGENEQVRTLSEVTRSARIAVERMAADRAAAERAQHVEAEQQASREAVQREAEATREVEAERE